MGSYIDCYDCKYIKEKKNSPDICKSEEAMKYFQKTFPERKIIFCTDLNYKHNCKFVKLKFGALVRKAFEDN